MLEVVVVFVMLIDSHTLEEDVNESKIVVNEATDLSA